MYTNSNLTSFPNLNIAASVTPPISLDMVYIAGILPALLGLSRIEVNSFFRSVALNEAIGGAASSQHCKGQAIDIDDVYGRKTNAEMYKWIQENLDYDQMIWEFGTDTQPNWIHVSYVSKEENRNKCLKAYKEHGKTKYKVISS